MGRRRKFKNAETQKYQIEFLSFMTAINRMSSEYINQTQNQLHFAADDEKYRILQ